MQCMDREASNVHLTKWQRCVLYRWSAVFQRCRRRRLLPPVHRLRRSLTRTTSQVRLWSSTTVDGKDVHLTTRISSLNPVQHDILPHCHSQLSDLTIRLYTATSFKSISQKRWLYHQMFKWSSDQFNSLNVSHMTSHSYSHWSIAFSWHILLRWPSM